MEKQKSKTDRKKKGLETSFLVVASDMKYHNQRVTTNPRCDAQRDPHFLQTPVLSTHPSAQNHTPRRHFDLCHYQQKVAIISPDDLIASADSPG